MAPSLKLGRLQTPPEERARNFRLARYLKALPSPPATIDATAGVTSWPMFSNDSLGDCVIAGAAHFIEMWTSEVDGKPRMVADQDVIDTYFKLTGGQDSGLNMLDVLNAWRKDGLLGDQILGFAEVDIKNHDEVRTAAWLFGGLFIGVNLPNAALQQFHAGQPWDVVPDDGGIAGGHCVDVVYLDSKGMLDVTWAKEQPTTWAWWDRYAEEVYCVIPRDLERLGGKPLQNGFNLAQLEADLQQLHHPVGPTPPPAPVPPPVPVPPSPPPPPKPPNPNPPPNPAAWKKLEALAQELLKDIRAILAGH